MKEFTINQNDASQRLDKFIQKSAPLLPKSMMYKYIRLKRIKVNGKRAEIAARLNAGDIVQMYINDEFFAQKPHEYEFMHASKKLSILYEDENILLADKPEGLIVHPDREEYGDTLIFRIQRYLYEKGEYLPENENSFAPALVNRIDRNTGGIVIAAKNAEALRILNQKLKDREIDKFYLCLVQGTLKKKQDTVTAYLIKDEDKNKVRVFSDPTPAAKQIKTQYRVLGEKGGQSLVEVKLLTGRTHQIRATFAYLGHPLVGDGKYGKNAADKKKGFVHQALYSYKLRFSFTTESGALGYLSGREFTVPAVWFAEQFQNSENNA